MKIEFTTGSYNERRYGKPWIALVDFTSNPQGDFKWGEWVGDAANGSDGLLIIEANAGDILAKGQKDFRKPKNSTPEWFQVENDGTIKPLAGKVEALRLARTASQATATTAQPN